MSARDLDDGLSALRIPPHSLEAEQSRASSAACCSTTARGTVPATC